MYCPNCGHQLENGKCPICNEGRSGAQNETANAHGERQNADQGNYYNQQNAYGYRGYQNGYDPYNGFYPPYYQRPRQTNPYAIVGLILSFLSPILGLIFSIIGYKKADEYGDGKGLSKAGIIISSVYMGLVVLIGMLYMVILFAFLVILA